MAMPAVYQSLKHFITVEEYLKFEETAETKHEYADGKIIAMAGTSLRHNDVARNITVSMEVQFGDRPCRAYISDIRLRTRGTRFRYPDVMALCGKPEADDSKPPCLLNPQVIIEVLSDSTMLIDLNEKLDEYMQVATLTDYLMFAQDKMWARHYAKQDSGDWTVKTYSKPQDALAIKALDITLTLADAYRKVELDAEPETSENGEMDAQETI